MCDKYLEIIHEALSLNNLNLSDIKLFTSHHCNLHLCKMMMNMLKLPEAKFFINNHKKFRHWMGSDMLLNDEYVDKLKHKVYDIMSLIFGAGGFAGYTLIRK